MSDPSARDLILAGHPIAASGELRLYTDCVPEDGTVPTVITAFIVGGDVDPVELHDALRDELASGRITDGVALDTLRELISRLRASFAIDG